MKLFLPGGFLRQHLIWSLVSGGFTVLIIVAVIVLNLVKDSGGLSSRSVTITVNTTTTHTTTTGNTAGIKQMLQSAAKASVGAGRSSRVPDPFQALFQKINAYRKCVYRYSDRALDSRRRYLSWKKDLKKLPTCKERYVSRGMYTVSDPTYGEQTVAKVRDAKPRLAELEQAGDRYLKALKVLAPLLKEADAYYTEEDYEDDDCAKGKALHPKLVAAWAEFEERDQELKRALVPREVELYRRGMARSEKAHGKGARYFFFKCMLEVRQLHDELRAQSRLDKPDVGKIEQIVTGFQQTVAALEGAYEKNKESLRSTALSSCVSDAKEVSLAAKEFWRRKKKGKRFRSIERGMLSGAGAWMVKGSFARVYNYFNKLQFSASYARPW
jgi:hypothetical protein